MVVRAAQGNFHFAGLKTKFFSPHGPGNEGVAILPEPVSTRLQGCVGNDVRLGLIAQQLPAWFSRGFTFDVPERHVECAHGANDCTSPPVHGTSHVELFPDSLWLAGIFAKEHFLKPKPHCVRTTGFDACFGNPGIDVGFADSGDSFIGVDEDDDIVLGRGRLILSQVGYEQGMTLDVGDFHR